jgi:multicomponent Na+:H+ antiporter subunit F
MSGSDALQAATLIALGILSLSLLVTAIRIVLGPGLPDRVLALDLITTIGIAFIGVIAIRTGFTLYLDIAIALTLLGFLSTVALARYILSRADTNEAEAAPDPVKQ